MFKHFATIGALTGLVLAAPFNLTGSRVELSAQSTFTDTCTVSEDTRLEQKAPTTNYQGATTLYAAGNVNGVGHMAEAALRFDCSAIPAGATILSATLKINVNAPSADMFHLFELLKTWTETGATWTNYAAGSPWAVAGARGSTDRAATVLGSFNAPAVGQRSIALNAAGRSLLSGWIDGGPNRGIVVRPPLTGDDVGFDSGETTSGAELVVVTAGGATHTLSLLADTRLEEKAPTTNYATATTLYGAGNVNGVGHMAAAALKFDTAAIPAGTALSSVTLRIDVTAPTTDRYDLYELKQDWTESGATWNNFASGAPWAEPGAKGASDRGTTVLGTFTGATTGLKSIPLDPAGVALVRAWIDNTTPNYGLLLRPTLTNDDVGFSSSETSAPPVIDVTYQTAGSPQTLTVITYNTKHDRNIAGVMDLIAAQTPRPDVVVLQETKLSNFNAFVSGLNSRYGLSGGQTFAGEHARYCNDAVGSTCNVWHSEGVSVLTRYPVCDTEQFWLQRADQWHDWRPAVRVQFSLPNGVAVQAYSIHLPVLQSARIGAVADLKTWASAHSSPRLIGGDFNAVPTDDEIDHPTNGMLQAYDDAWSVGSGSGFTHDNDTTLDRRIDYWFSNDGGSATPIAASVPSSSASDHLPVLVRYTIPTGATCSAASRDASRVLRIAGRNRPSETSPAARVP